MTLSEALVNTAFLPAFLAFGVSVTFWKYYKLPNDMRWPVVGASMFWGVCYLLVLFRVPWFVENQVLFFRNANVLIMLALLYRAIRKEIISMLREIWGNVRRNFNVRE